VLNPCPSTLGRAGFQFLVKLVCPLASWNNARPPQSWSYTSCIVRSNRLSSIRENLQTVLRAEWCCPSPHHPVTCTHQVFEFCCYKIMGLHLAVLTFCTPYSSSLLSPGIVCKRDKNILLKETIFYINPNQKETLCLRIRGQEDFLNFQTFPKWRCIIPTPFILIICLGSGPEKITLLSGQQHSALKLPCQTMYLAKAGEVVHCCSLQAAAIW
jgi:hypothetical protein